MHATTAVEIIRLRLRVRVVVVLLQRDIVVTLLIEEKIIIDFVETLVGVGHRILVLIEVKFNKLRLSIGCRHQSRLSIDRKGVYRLAWLKNVCLCSVAFRLRDELEAGLRNYLRLSGWRVELIGRN